MTDWLPWTVAVPLVAALADFLLGARARALTVSIALAALLAAVLGVGIGVLHGGTWVHAVGAWGAPLGIELRADGLSALMLIMTGGVGAVVSVYALAYFERAQARHFWPLWWFLWAALNALFLSADVFNLYVTLELLGLAAVGLVALNGEPAALRAALRYLFATLVGSAAYLMGVALLYGAHGTLALAELAARVVPGPAAWLALALMVGGMLLKTALFPLHFWLPPAHGTAAAPVSAVLSGLVIKASFYLMLRLWFELFSTTTTPAVAQFLGVLAATAILWGGWLALRQQRLKALIAWSTVAQVGYLFLLFPLAGGAAAAEAWQGGVYQALSHAFAKSAMFLAAGCFIEATAADDVERLNGISARLPVALFAFALGGVSLMGLPPSGGFIAKWLLLRAAAEDGQWWWAAVIIAGGLITAAYVFRVLRRAFLAPPAQSRFHPVPRTLELAAFLLALVALALGLNATAPLSLLAVEAPYVVRLQP